MKNRIILTLLTILMLPPCAAHAGGQFSIGAEGFYDQYREPIVDVTTDSGYGSLLAGYVYNTPSFFAALDGRFSYGYANYKSPDGKVKGTPQYEGEARLRAGPNFGNFSPYVGIGGRFFLDNGTGTFTNLGYGGYDRHINQFYIPIGADLQIALPDGWAVQPNLEYDQLIYGTVKSDLAPFTGYNIHNNQHDGYGLRGSLMFGHNATNRTETSWQFGPFFRYWKIKDSNIYTGPDGGQWLEPENSRLQVGAKLRYIFK